MTGRVLNDAQIKIIERNLPRWSFCGGIATQQVPDLIETIRDRDKTIVALESRLSNWQHEAWDYKHENTILREALEHISKGLIETKEPWEIAQETLEKIREQK